MSGPANQDPIAEADRQRARAARYRFALEGLHLAAINALEYISKYPASTEAGRQARAEAAADLNAALKAAEDVL